jgi:hypothetical protein
MQAGGSAVAGHKKRPRQPSLGRAMHDREAPTPTQRASSLARSRAFSHPDYTVGSGISPDRADGVIHPLAGCNRRSGLGQHNT